MLNFTDAFSDFFFDVNNTIETFCISQYNSYKLVLLRQLRQESRFFDHVFPFISEIQTVNNEFFRWYKQRTKLGFSGFVSSRKLYRLI